MEEGLDIHAPDQGHGIESGAAGVGTLVEPDAAESEVAPTPDDLNRPSNAGGTARLWTIGMVVVAGAVGTFIRAWLLFHQPVTSDEAVAGLIAHEILHGHTYAFFWGQPFGGVEPYVVAAVFAVFGQNSLTLGLGPILLSAVAAILVWRVALRLVDSPQVALLAGAMAWVAPFPVVFSSTIEGGYRGVTLACGLGVLLLSLRILDGKFRVAEFVAFGLIAGLGWWSLPEIAYFLIPAGLVLIGAMVQSYHAGELSRWAGRIGWAVLAFVVGAFPWIWTNFGSGFASLDASKFPGSVTPAQPRLRRPSPDLRQVHPSHVRQPPEAHHRSSGSSAGAGPRSIRCWFPWPRPSWLWCSWRSWSCASSGGDDASPSGWPWCCTPS